MTRVPLHWRVALALVLPVALLGLASGWTRSPGLAALVTAGLVGAGAVGARRLSTVAALVARTAERFAAGDYTARLALGGAPEWRALAAALNGVAAANARREEQLNRALDDAANQRDLFYSIIDASSDGLLLYDKDRRLLAANLRCGELLGRTVHDLLTQSRHVLQEEIARRCADPEIYEARLERHFACPNQPHQDLLILREPQRRVLRRCSSPIISQRGVQGRVFTYTDVTVEADVDQMRSEFVSMASHELRTPLTSVHGALQLALCGSGDRLAAEDRELLQISLASTERLVRLVTDLLDLSKIEAGRMPLLIAPVRVPELLDAAAKTMQGLAATRGARIEVAVEQDGAVVLADRDHLLRVLANLLSNAIKYSPPGSTVWLQARLAADGVEVAVEDQGPGVPPDHVDRLFRPFSRLGAHERQMSGGTGLGLAITRAIVEQHGGRIWLEHRQPSGSRFVFVVPAVVAPGVAPLALPPAAGAAAEGPCLEPQPARRSEAGAAVA